MSPEPRYKSLLKIVKKANSEATKAGLQLKMPPLKFFVPFCEAASLEDVETENSLRDIWANLLIRASEADDSQNLLFLKILQQIGFREVSLLIDIVENGRATTYAQMLSWLNPLDVEIMFFHKSGLELTFRCLDIDFDVRYIADLIVDCSECSGVLIDSICVLGDDPEVDEVSAKFDHKLSEMRRVPANILISLGIIEKFNIDGFLLGKFDPTYALHANGYRITGLGVDFYRLCSGREFKSKFANKLDFSENGLGFGQWKPPAN